MDLTFPSTERKNSADDPANTNMKPSKSQSKMSQDLTQGIDDIQILVLCLKVILNYSRGIHIMFGEENSIYALATCILHPYLRTKALVFELLSVVCLIRGGHEMVMEAFDRFRVVYKGEYF